MVASGMVSVPGPRFWIFTVTFFTRAGFFGGQRDRARRGDHRDREVLPVVLAVEHAVAVAVLIGHAAAADAGRRLARIGRAAVVGVAGAVRVGVGIDHGVAVVVDAVADLGRTRMDGGVGVVAIGAAGRDARDSRRRRRRPAARGIRRVLAQPLAGSQVSIVHGSASSQSTLVALQPVAGSQRAADHAGVARPSQVTGAPGTQTPLW